MAKKDYNYFSMLERMVKYSCSAAKELHNNLNNFDLKELDKRIEHMHEIEHSADMEKHSMMEHLAKEFITPIEREDIILLAEEIDNVTDCIEDVLIKMYMFNVQTIKKEAIDFTEVIVKCCEALEVAVGEFSDFKRSKNILESIVEVNHLEEKGDTLYIDSVRKLFLNSQNQADLIAWSEIFKCLEKCCDACEHVADAVEEVIMKNS